MNAVFILLVLSAIVGFALGFLFSWIAILVSGLVLAFLSAAVLQNEDFGFLAGIAIIVICLTVNQVFYLIGGMTPVPRARNPRTDSMMIQARIAKTTLVANKTGENTYQL
jgi:hypothetical protein